MRPAVAIIAPAPAVNIDAAAEHIIVALAGEREAESSAKRYQQNADAARETARLRRLEVGRWLLKVRPTWPASGPKAKGWGEFLARVKLDDSTAVRYMDAARTSTVHGGPSKPSSSQDSAHESGVSQTDEAPAPREVSTADLLALLEQRAPELGADDRARARRLLKPQREDDGGDRDSWCTPPEITGALPPVDLDPCSNERSTVRAARQCWLSRGEDGLKVPWRGSLWINGPFSDLEPWAVKLVEEWPQITACGWLCNTDSTTEWWRLVVSVLPLRLDLNDRTAFVPPPGVKASSNDRPQTLLMTDSFWRGCDQAALLKLGTLWRRSGAREIVR